MATAVLAPTSGGTGTVTVTFDNQTDSINFTATAATTATSLAILAIPSATYLYGQPSGFTVQLTPSNATGITASNFQVLVDGSASLGGNPFGLILIGNNDYQIFGPFNLLGTGAHTLAINFLGTTDFGASTAIVTANVNQGSVAISDTITPATPVQGQGGSINITVGGIGSGVLPTGTVSYAFDGGAPNTATLSAGAAVISIPATLSAGSHSASISSLGDTNYAAGLTSVPSHTVCGELCGDHRGGRREHGRPLHDRVRRQPAPTAIARCAPPCWPRRAEAPATSPSTRRPCFAQTITLSGTMNIPSNTTITGATTGSGTTLQNLVTISGGGSSSNFSIFTVNSGVTAAAIHNLIIANGHIGAQGGGINSSGSLTVTGSTFLHNFAGGVPSGGNGGGAIYASSGALVVSNNRSAETPAPAEPSMPMTETVTINRSTFSGNSALVPQRAERCSSTMRP